MKILKGWKKKSNLGEILPSPRIDDEIIIMDSIDGSIPENGKEEEHFNVELSLKSALKENESIQTNDTTTNMKVTRTKLCKKFGETRKTTASKSVRPLITVDEMEKNSESKEELNLDLTRVNSKMSQMSRLSNLSNKSKLTYLSQNRKNNLMNSKSKHPHIRPNESGLSTVVRNNTTKVLNKNSRSNKHEKTLTFNFSLDSIDGISCINYGNDADDQTPEVIVSYFHKSLETGEIKRYDIASLPLKKLYMPNDRKTLYHARFEDSDDLGKKQSFSVSLAMTPNARSTTGYSMKEFYLQVGLKKGQEIIRLGSGILPLHGDEIGKRKSIPVGEVKLITSFTGNKSRVSHVSKMITEGLEPVSFLCDSERKYALQRSNLLISSVRVDENHNQISSMVIFPAIDEKISNISYDDTEYTQDCGVSNGQDSNEREETGSKVSFLQRNFQRSMNELLNLQSNSDDQFDLRRKDVRKSWDESTVFFEDKNNYATLTKVQRDIRTLVLSSSEETAMSNSQIGSSYSTGDDTGVGSSVYESDAHSSFQTSDTESEHTNGRFTNDYESIPSRRDEESSSDDSSVCSDESNGSSVETASTFY